MVYLWAQRRVSEPLGLSMFQVKWIGSGRMDWLGQNGLAQAERIGSGIMIGSSRMDWLRQNGLVGAEWLGQHGLVGAEWIGSG